MRSRSIREIDECEMPDRNASSLTLSPRRRRNSLRRVPIFGIAVLFNVAEPLANVELAAAIGPTLPVVRILNNRASDLEDSGRIPELEPGNGENDV